MKIMNTFETAQVAGGLNIRGVNFPVDTSGIPGRCRGQLDAFANDIVLAADRPNLSASQLFDVMGPHMDAMMASGCDAYVELYASRINALASRYA